MAACSVPFRLCGGFEISRCFRVVFPPHDSEARGGSGFWRLLAVNPKTDLFLPRNSG